MLKVRINADAVLIGVALVLVPVFVRAYAPPPAPFVAQDGKSTTRYDATASADPRGRVRQYAYDPLGRRTAAIKPSGATDRFGYDGLGNWTAFTNAEGRVYTMAYDAMGRILAATNAADEQVFANRYDPVGNLTNRTDGAGNTVAYSYDVLNRLVSDLRNLRNLWMSSPTIPWATC